MIEIRLSELRRTQSALFKLKELKIKNLMNEVNKGAIWSCKDYLKVITEGNPPLSATTNCSRLRTADGIFIYSRAEPGLPE
jgi:hypothetical protein